MGKCHKQVINQSINQSVGQSMGQAVSPVSQSTLVLGSSGSGTAEHKHNAGTAWMAWGMVGT